MLRPERMSKVSVTGSRGVMARVIETVHELHLVHLSDYDGSWEGFDNGDPIEGADEASEKLVTVRALESTLGLEGDDLDVPDRLEDGWEARLERVRTEINELDDRRTEVRDELRVVDERIDRVEPFAELGIDLDLLSGYDAVEVVVGEGSVDAIDAALEASDDVRASETFTGGDVVAIVAAPTDDADEGVIGDALVGVEFTRHEVPETDESPEAFVETLETRKRELEGDVDDIDADLERIEREHGGFLLRVEEELTVEVQRAEAPLQFATTERAFVAEGWLPTEAYDALVAALNDAVGDSVEVEELERADYDRHGAPVHAAPVPHGGKPEEEAAADEDEADEERAQQRAATDGGSRTDATGAGAGGGADVVTMPDDPPVVLDNLSPARPFEMMVKMVNQPKYTELDPTLLVFLTFPLAFGFMIGDIGYGLLYMAMGYGAWKVFDSDAGRAIGTIGLWAGGFTVLFGYLYDDFLGIHMHDLGLHLPLTGVFSKGIQTTEWVLLWSVVCLLFALVHLNVGLVVGFVNELAHGLRAAIYEKASWILALNGLFLWIFSHEDAGGSLGGTDLTASGAKPEFFVGEGAVLHSSDYFMDLGFAGVPEAIGVAGLVAFLVGLIMIVYGEGVAGAAETPAWLFGHVLSYLRIVAVLLAKGVMAFVVNLLVFGAYAAPDGYMYFDLPGQDVAELAGTADLQTQFAGIIHMGDGPVISAAAVLLGIVVFVVGHVVVLLLGITAAGIQMLRLEYVEFFQKFYEGGGEEYDPFGEERPHAAD